jgi:hypothetical protein
MGLFSGTAPYYARFRPGYPQAFFSDVITRFALNGTGRSLDLGCGTGSRSAFRDVTPVVHEFERIWTVDRIIGYLYSTSLPLRRLLGDRRPAFERDLTTALLTAVPTGRFTEPVTLKVLLARRPP